MAAVHPHTRGDLHTLEVAACDGEHATSGVAPAGTHGVGPPGRAVVAVARGVGGSCGLGPVGHLVGGVVVHHDAQVDVLVESALAGGVGSGHHQVVPDVGCAGVEGFVGQQQGVSHRGGILGYALVVGDAGVVQVVLYLCVAVG